MALIFDILPTRWGIISIEKRRGDLPLAAWKTSSTVLPSFAMPLMGLHLVVLI